MPIITSNISGYGSNSPIQISGSIVFANTQAPGSDTAFFVSGSNSARAVFGGALVVSGVLGVSGSTSLGDNVEEDTVTIRATSVLQGTTAIGTTTTSGAFFTVSGSSTASTPTMLARAGVASPTGGVGIFDVQNSAGTSLFFVSGSGTVGINTNNPNGAGLYVSSSLTGNAASALIIGGQVLGVSLNTYKGHTQLFQLGNGTEVMRLNSLGNVGIGTGTYTARLFVSGSSTATTPTMVVREGIVSPTGGAGTFDVQNSVGTSLFFVSGSGFVGVGTSNNLVGTKVAIYGATAPDTFTGHILLSSDTASSAINNGGQLNFQMYDGSSYRGSGFIKSAKENGTASNYSSYMSFGTRNSGDIVITERMRIDSTGSVGIGATAAGRLYVTGSTSTSQPVFVVRAGTTEQTGGTKIVDVLNAAGTGLFHVSGSGDVTVGVGNLVIGTSGKGIDFGSTANAPSGSLGQEILDDYEEGSWTPGTTVGGGGTITSTRSGHYTKIGRVVHVKFFIEASAVSGTRTTLAITGLPFQVDVTYTNAWVECYQLNNTGGLTDDFSHGMVWTNATSNSLTFDIYETISGTPIVSPASFIVAGTLISGHLTYFTNQ